MGTLFVVFLAAVLAVAFKPKQLVPLPTEGELFDPDDMVEVYNWLVAKLTPKVGEADAFDLVQEAVETSLPGQPFAWSREGETTLVTHLIFRVTDIRRNKRRRKDYAVAAYDEENDPRNLEGPAVDEIVDAKRRHARLAAAAEAEFADSPLVKPVLERIMAGIFSSAAEHAAATGITAPQAVNAKRRIVAFIKQWAAEQDRAEEQA